MAPGWRADFAATFEQRQSGDAADAEFCGELLLDLGIDLSQTHVGFELLRSFGKLWRHHFARTAPGRPKIHDDWNIAALDGPLKGSVGKLNGLSGKGALVALAALGLVIQTRSGNAVDRIAMRADDMQYFTHVRDRLAHRQ
jgi:hypothetical protein